MSGPPSVLRHPCKGVESLHRLVSLGQLILSLFALLFSCIDFGDTLLRVWDHEHLIIDLILDGLEELLEYSIAKENDLTTGHQACVQMSHCHFCFQLKDNMPSCDEEEPLTAATFGNKKAACTLSARCELAAMGDRMWE